MDPVLNLTTSGSKWPEDIRRAHLPILKPEMCSYDPGTMNWANSYIFSNSPASWSSWGMTPRSWASSRSARSLTAA